MHITNQFESDFFDLMTETRKAHEENPQSQTIKNIYFNLGRLWDSYERQKEKEKAENQKSVKSLLKNILKCLNED